MTRGFRVRAGGRRPLRALDAATGDRGVAAQRAGALERAALVLADFQQALAALGRGRGPHGQGAGGARPGRAGDQHPGTVGGWRCHDPGRDRRPASTTPKQWSSTPACAPDNALGAFAGKTTISGSRPAAAAAGRLAGGVGRVVAQPVVAARSTHLTSRQHNRLSDTQARGAVAEALLRQLWVVCVNRSRGSWRWPAAPPGQGGDRPGRLTRPRTRRGEPDLALEQPADQPGQPHLPPPSSHEAVGTTRSRLGGAGGERRHRQRRWHHAFSITGDHPASLGRSRTPTTAPPGVDLRRIGC
jgi:hypothetical protein